MAMQISTNGADGFAEHSGPSIIVPGEKSVTLSSSKLEHQVKLLQSKLASTSDFTQRTIAVALPNSIELVSIFLAITRNRGIAALLNPGNKESEFDFYLDDVDPEMVIVSKGESATNSDSVRAARRHGSGIAECYWDGQDVILDIIAEKARTPSEYSVDSDIKPLENDIALLLHTSGTTGRPKAVSVVFS